MSQGWRTGQLTVHGVVLLWDLLYEGLPLLQGWRINAHVLRLLHFQSLLARDLQILTTDLVYSARKLAPTLPQPSERSIQRSCLMNIPGSQQAADFSSDNEWDSSRWAPADR